MFDAFLPRLTDSNSKVNLHALEAFSNMVPLLGDLLLPIVTNIVEALGPNLASKQATIHNTAETVLELITQCISKCVCGVCLLFNVQLRRWVVCNVSRQESQVVIWSHVCFFSFLVTLVSLLSHTAVQWAKWDNFCQL